MAQKLRDSEANAGELKRQLDEAVAARRRAEQGAADEATLANRDAKGALAQAPARLEERHAAELEKLQKQHAKELRKAGNASPNRDVERELRKEIERRIQIRKYRMHRARPSPE